MLSTYYVRHFYQSCTYINSFKTHTHSVIKFYYHSHFKYGNTWGMERLSNLPVVTVIDRWSQDINSRSLDLKSIVGTPIMLPFQITHNTKVFLIQGKLKNKYGKSPCARRFRLMNKTCSLLFLVHVWEFLDSFGCQTLQAFAGQHVITLVMILHSKLSVSDYTHKQRCCICINF